MHHHIKIIFVTEKHQQVRIYKSAKQIKTAHTGKIMENLNTMVKGTQPQNCYSLSDLPTTTIGQTIALCLFLVISLVGNTLIAIII